MRRVVVVLAVLTVVLASLIAIRLYTQARALAGPASGSGEVEGTEIDLSSRVGARIVAMNVREGDRVKKGDLLVALDCADPAAQLAEAESRLAAARAQVVAAEAQIQSARRGQVAAAAAEQAAAAQARSLAAQRDAAARQAARLEKL
ncbi:MAG TPA: biotin/lipoyl-binding protein, partial [Anaeromyxobacteraceae bacterium]|nr:biotin/lipoyl-binding protein [Anaeromyxobacteraceae bacterium]